jgi:hypothetical protein
MGSAVHGWKVYVGNEYFCKQVTYCIAYIWPQLSISKRNYSYVSVCTVILKTGVCAIECKL